MGVEESEGHSSPIPSAPQKKTASAKKRQIAPERFVRVTNASGYFLGKAEGSAGLTGNVTLARQMQVWLHRKYRPALIASHKSPAGLELGFDFLSPTMELNQNPIVRA